MEKFTAAMVHDKDTITKLSVTQYNCFEFKSKLVRIVIAIALIVYGLYANQSMYTPRICLILGCILIANVNLRPRVRANKIIEQIGALELFLHGHRFFRRRRGKGASLLAAHKAR